jgi:hypothetical protein
LNTNCQSFRNLILLLFAVIGFSLTITAQNAWINEIHYDNIGNDTNEIVEVIIENPENYTLSSFQVILYSGGDTKSYDTRNLSAFSTGATSGNFVIYSFNYTLAGSSIQNGNADGLALVYNGIVIPGQFLSYEGTFTASNGPANGMTSVDIIVDEQPAVNNGLSLQLSGDGFQYAHFTWQNPATATPGALNNNQIIFENPVDFNASTYSQAQIDLSWTLNANNDDVMVAWNSSPAFGTPSGAYSEGDPVSGGGTVLYNGPLTSSSHINLAAGSTFYYKAWSVTGANIYSSGIVDSATTRFPEPSNNPSGLAATSNGHNYVTVSWTDSDASNYLVKGSNTGYSSIAAPVDGVAEPDALLVKNVSSAIQQFQFTGLMPGTQYFFKIFPYKVTGGANNYKTDGAVPQASATTHDLDIDLIISNIADPLDNAACRYVELYNTGTSAIDFSSDLVYLCLQANGSSSSWSSVPLAGTLPAGEAYIVAFSGTYFDTAFNQTADLYSNIINVSGNDGVFLYYGGNQTTGILFDAFGQINVDGNGTAWEYTDGQAVRKRTITGFNTTWTQDEWVIVRHVNYDNMAPGLHGADITWLGTTSTGWNSRGNNWSSPHGYVPDASCNVIIPNASRYPIITEPSACNQLLIQGGSAMSIQAAGSLIIVGR